MFGNMPYPNMMPFGMPNMGMGNNFNPQINLGGNQNQNLFQIYNNGVNIPQQNNNSPLFEKKFNILFKTTGGLQTRIIVDRGTPLCNVLLKYLKRVQKPELYEPDSGIFFFKMPER